MATRAKMKYSSNRRRGPMARTYFFLAGPPAGVISVSAMSWQFQVLVECGRPGRSKAGLAGD
jgi:hypothetical protein